MNNSQYTCGQCDNCLNESQYSYHQTCIFRKRKVSINHEACSKFILRQTEIDLNEPMDDYYNPNEEYDE